MVNIKSLLFGISVQFGLGFSLLRPIFMTRVLCLAGGAYDHPPIVRRSVAVACRDSGQATARLTARPPAAPAARRGAAATPIGRPVGKS
jgi:hypothetical protein